MITRLLAVLLLGTALTQAQTNSTPLKVGDKAPDFTLKTLDDQSVRLSEVATKGNVVLIVLRGWPG